MLATYFKQYPPHLAKIAQRQAETQSLPTASPEPSFLMDDSPQEDNLSDSGRTYTISEQSNEGECMIHCKTKNSSSPESDRKIQKSHSLEIRDKSPVKNGERRSPILNSKEKKSPTLKQKKSPDLRDRKVRKSPVKDNNYILENRKSPEIKDRKSPPSNKDRPSTLELTKDRKNGVNTSARLLASSNRSNLKEIIPTSVVKKASPRSPTKDGPVIIESKKPEVTTTTKVLKKSPPARSPLSELFKSRTLGDASSISRKSPPKDLLAATTKQPNTKMISPDKKMRERSISLEETTTTASSCKLHLDNRFSTPLKIIPKEDLTEEEDYDMMEPEDDSSSDDEEDLSTTTFNRHSPLNSNSSSPRKVVKSTSPVDKEHKPLRSASQPSHVAEHKHEDGGGGCPLHGSKSHHHISPPLESPATPPPILRPATRGRASSSSSSARSSAAENQILYCGMCDQKFSNPKVLPCLHTFCESCLITYTPDESITLTCPLCRQQSILPKDGVTGLQNNSWVNGIMDALENPNPTTPPAPCSTCEETPSKKSCVQCNLVFCEQCAKQHLQDSTSDEHSVVSLDEISQSSSSDHQEDTTTTLFCSSHSGEALRYYCGNCETAVCSSCTAIEHRTHDTMRLSEAVHDQKIGLHKLIEKVTSRVPCVKEVVCDLGDISKQLDLKRHVAENQIRNSFQTLHDVLGQRETELMNTLNKVVTIKKNSIEDQKLELEDWVAGVEGGCEYVEKALTNCPAMEVVLIKKQLGEKLSHYAEVDFPPVPKENAHLQYLPGSVDHLKSAFRNVGLVQTNAAVPQQSSAIGTALKSTVVGRQVLVTVVTRDHKGERVKGGGAEVSAIVTRCKLSFNGHDNDNHFKHDSNCLSSRSNSRTEIEPHIMDLRNGNYEVTFNIHHEGIYKLSLLLFGQHIHASPFTITAHPSDTESCASDQGSLSGGRRKSSRSTQLSKNSRTSKTSVSKAPSHKSSCSRNTIPIEDDLIFRVGTRGRGRGEFVNPQGICYAPVKDGRIVLADSNNQCVQVFTMTGECKIKFGIRGRNVGQMQRPTGVAFLPSGNYAVADYENRWISIFEPNGKYVSRIGHGKLLGPKGLCVNNEGNIIVVDNKASCICIFSPSGKLLTKFGNRIVEGYNFAGPHFCAVNSRGDIIITDFHNHCVRVFDSEGISLFTFGTSGEGNGQFNAPTGVAVDNNDNIIVADWGNSRIQVFDHQGSFLSFVNTQADPLYGPQGLSLTADGNVMVADSGNHCFKMYKYLQ